MIKWLKRNINFFINRFYYTMKCPICKNEITFLIRDGVDCNIESNETYRDDNLRYLELWSGCNNPLCEWSKVKRL